MSRNYHRCLGSVVIVKTGHWELIVLALFEVVDAHLFGDKIAIPCSPISWISFLPSQLKCTELSHNPCAVIVPWGAKLALLIGYAKSWSSPSRGNLIPIWGWKYNPPARFKLRAYYSFLVNFPACRTIRHMCTMYVPSAASLGTLTLRR